MKKLWEQITEGQAAVITAVATLLAAIIGGYFLIRGAMIPTELEIKATQTAEAKLPHVPGESTKTSNTTPSFQATGTTPTSPGELLEKIPTFTPSIKILTSTSTDIPQPFNSSVTPMLLPSSPDHHQIGFNQKVDGNQDIYLINSDGMDLIRLTDNPADDICPTWSPDGNQIAFSTNRDGNNEIYILSLATSELTNLTNNSAGNYCPQWSPAGPQIAFFANDRVNTYSGKLQVVNLDGTVQNEWPLTNASYLNYRWSPDGTKLAYSYLVGNQNYALYIADRHGPGISHLVDTTVTMHRPKWSWSPDSQYIVIPADFVGDGKIDLYAINVTDINHSIRLTNDSIIEDNPAWSPDGTKILFTATHDGANHIYTLTLNGLERNLIASGQTTEAFNWGNIGSFVWSPDETQILFDDFYRLYVMNDDGSQLTRLIDHEPGPVLWGGPVWRPGN